ncbi:MAG: Maf family protein [Chloroflexia bacterium]
MPRLVLASSSPRRIELLKLLVADFLTATSDVEETGSDLLPGYSLHPNPEDIDPNMEPGLLARHTASLQIPNELDPALWAWRKAMDVAGRATASDQDPVTLGADTVVVNEGTLLGKPSDREHAVDMLRSLRGRMHFVFTGYAVVVLTRGGTIRTRSVGMGMSSVWMRNYSDEELKGYVATDEPLDKAGAYAVQGLGGALVERVEGCYRNVVGLPLCAVREALADAGVEVLPYPEGGYCPGCKYVNGQG